MSTYIKNSSGCSRLVDPLITRDDKSLKNWGTWCFMYGNGTYTYLFFPGIHVTEPTSACTVTFPVSNTLRIELYSNSSAPTLTFSKSEYDRTTQQCQGIMITFNHSGIGYGGYGILQDDITISA